ncbi:MAG: Dna2/Cas4 domain-containing protein [Chloroflexota bacterium]|nr:Dna2/Cas4 domain-containing protein [Chloroflexota bacterium]
MFWFLVGGALVLLILGWGLTLRSGRNTASAGLGRVRVVYSDTGGWEKVSEPLYSERYGLTGRPDYVVRSREGVAAVEVKPLRHSEKPYESDLFQLAAYCLLLEEDWLESPTFGLLRYADRTFRLEWSAELRAELLAVIDEMRELMCQPAILGESMPTPQHDMTARCYACGFHYVCWPSRKN